MWGLNQNGQCGCGNTDKVILTPTPIDLSHLTSPEKTTFLALGREHSSLLTDQGHVFTWGASSYGRLGHSDTTKVFLFFKKIK